MAEVLAVKHWRDSASFDAQDRALLAFCEKFTFESGFMTAADLHSLRTVGFSEKQALDIVLICGYRHYIARIADGVGIDLDPMMQTVKDIVTTYSYEHVSGESPLAAALKQSAGKATPLEGTTSGPWIATVPDAEVDPSVQAVYRAWQGEFGVVPNLLRALSFHPKALCTADAFRKGVTFGGSGLGMRRENLIALTAADINRSPYFLAWHGELLRRELGSRDAAIRMRDWRNAGLERAEEQMLSFAEKLTLDEGRMNQDDADALRAVGFTDPLILDVIVEVAYLNCFTRIANALGVPVDAEWR
ncbi:MAG: peroxidase-related enzyme [Deltaproteobacteria bacterium]|nr:peroxidase-related enzyme [Deltaproteobacteria bacterium]